MTDRTPIVAEALRVHGTLHDHERESLIEHWARLDNRLQSFDRRAVTLDLYINDRDTVAQRVTLEAGIPGFGTFVAKDESRDLPASLSRVRDELIRQLTDAKTKAEPRSNRRLRESRRV